jgi:hypothetical protein
MHTMLLKHLARLLTILALLAAPVGMLSGHAAMAAPGVSGGHCAEVTEAHDQAPEHAAPAVSVDCAIACACVPPIGAQLAEAPPLADRAAATPPIAFVAGFNLTADPPPPRKS